MDYIIVRKINMPGTLPAVTRKDADGNYNIYINAAVSIEKQNEAYWHEVEHIRRGHFYEYDADVDDLEYEANQHGEANETTIRQMAHKGFTWT